MHPFISPFIQPLSLLQYLLSTYWNQVPVLDRMVYSDKYKYWEMEHVT